MRLDAGLFFIQLKNKAKMFFEKNTFWSDKFVLIGQSDWLFGWMESTSRYIMVSLQNPPTHLRRMCLLSSCPICSWLSQHADSKYPMINELSGLLLAPARSSWCLNLCLSFLIKVVHIIIFLAHIFKLTSYSLQAVFNWS